MRSAPGGLAAACAALAACARPAEPGGPRWISLAEGYPPPQSRGVADLEEGAWIESSIASEAWQPGRLEGSWHTALPEKGGPRGTKAQEVRVWVGERELARGNVPIHRLAELPVGAYTLARGQIHARLEPGEGPPPAGRCAVFVPFGAERGGRWRMTVDGYAGDALPGLPGRPVELDVDIPPSAMLRFFGVAKSLRDEPSELAWRILLDGEELGSGKVRAERRAAGAWGSVALPPEGRAGAQLSFEVTSDGAEKAGADARVLFSWMAPTIGPAEVAGYGERSGTRPGVLLYLIDTFRADNLAAYGGDPGLMPILNALSERSVVFPRTWSTAPWTLPSQTSMLTGLYPPEHGVEAALAGISPELTTLAEHLAAHGYRTGAITDSGFVSRVFGFDHGFEWFLEIKDSLLSTTYQAALDFLAADDGRPVFLFVHTFRVHTPYRMGDDEDDSRYMEIEEEHFGSGMKNLPPEVHAELERLYRRGVADLDRASEPWLAEMEELGFFENGYLVLTSDHGEAFGEHGQLFHGMTIPWEEEIRIPLVLYGGDLEGRLDPRPASLTDLPLTIADLVGVPPASGWKGASLLGPSEDRAVLAYSGKRVAVVEGDRKVMGIAARGPARRFLLGGVFDLAADPGETLDLAPDDPAARETLVSAARRWIDRTSTPIVDPASVELSQDDLDHLEALGYGGEE